MQPLSSSGVASGRSPCASQGSSWPATVSDPSSRSSSALYLLSSHSSSSTTDQSRPAGIHSSLEAVVAHIASGLLHGGASRDAEPRRAKLVAAARNPAGCRDSIRSTAGAPAQVVARLGRGGTGVLECGRRRGAARRGAPAVQAPEAVVQALEAREQLLIRGGQAEAAEDDVLCELRRPHAAHAARGVQLPGAQLLAQELDEGLWQHAEGRRLCIPRLCCIHPPHVLSPAAARAGSRAPSSAAK
ncbi:MAG: hypothetical protein J3K34DRAFT_417797 [Monoraphidium minutum]|nr:MAG: hypothetical protein J3K34DRAFT_417797 [Monoraphidium minutum]